MKALVILLAFLLGSSWPSWAQESSGAGRSMGPAPLPALQSLAPAAKAGDEVITFEELGRAVGVELAQIEQQRHALLSQKLGELIEERLLAREAKKRGVTVEQLLKSEVFVDAPRVTESEVTAFIAKNRPHFPSVDEAQLFKVWEYLRSAKLAQRRQAYVRALRAEGEVAVHLMEPAAARVHIGSDEGYWQGAMKAPVAIVEFSDFQCPYCKAVLPVIRQLPDKYPSKVKWVFRDFPIPAIHPTALKAHEAARCAGAQGRFWEYHDILFERSPRHSLHELNQYAQELGLHASAFAACLDKGMFEIQVNRDIQVGARLGISGTPTFLVNGCVYWNVGPDAAHTQGHVHAAVFSLGTLALVAQPHIFNNAFCFGYPVVTANKRGDLGISIAAGGKAGGGDTAAQGFVGIDDEFTTGIGFFGTLVLAASGTHNRSDARYGDYFTIHPYEPCEKWFTATNYALLNGTAVANVNSRYIEFGRNQSLRCYNSHRKHIPVQ
jgi:protein-disulfide isomerase